MPIIRLTTLARALWLPAALTASVAAADTAPSIAEAARNHDTALVRALVARHAAVDAPEPDGTTALHWAVHNDDADAVALLLRAGANVRAANRYGVTALSLACTNGNAAIVEQLIRAGADPNAAVSAGETPLMTAARTGRVDTLKVLVAHGADVNAREGWRGQTALMWAAAEQHPPAVRLLVEAGADLHARSNGGLTPLLFAVRAGDAESVEALVAAGASVGEAAPNGTNALQVAILNAHYELAARLLDRGADPNDNRAGWTALHTAVLAHKPVRANLPDPEPTGSMDCTSLVKVLLAHGADPNARIVRQPRDRNYLNLVGATPFLLAAKNADLPAMRLLVAAGSDPSAVTKEKTTALMLAAGIGYFEGESPGSEAEALEAVRLALELGGSVTAADAVGDTALHGAAVRGANTIVKFLVEQGARLDARNQKGWTPLTIADGVFIARSYKAQAHTAALLRQLTAQ